ncbi:Structural maintenance of chromosomes protein 6 [Tulasnella sp. JGI-2019a]|nr:Structural maintenance of chromosomes protein 6 [Tulasnella sp. JGI-2019a]
MVKRRSAIPNDDDENLGGFESHPPHKRAKREPKDITNEQDLSDDQDESIGEDHEEDEEGDVDLNASNGIDERKEEEYELGNEEKIRAYLSQKITRGSIAQSGVIHSLELKNFMCHRHLTFDFGPQINFITGRNGSGKSAVLSALQIALGARTYLTGRGTNLKAFIKEGRDEAEIWLKIKNGGPEAFKKDEYGNMIIIYRKIKRDGTSTWQMKSKDGKIISRSKADLQEMSDHMNIQIDSPLNVLTQDAARQFLASATSADKYAFFLKGTQLAQLTEEYEVIKDNIRKSEKILAQKEEIIPELKQAARDATNKLNEAQKARDQTKKLKELKKELAWSHVNSKHKELLSEQEAEANQARKVAKGQAHVDEQQAKVDDISARSAELSASQEHDVAVDTQLADERKALTEQIRRNKAKIQEYTADIGEMNQNLTTINKLIADVDQQITAENLKLQSGEFDKREAIRVQLEETKTTLEAKEAELAQMVQERLRLEQAVADTVEQGRNAEADLKKTERDLADARAWKATQMSNEKSKYNAFGNNIERILHDIKNARWVGPSPPIGPLGMYVTLKDPSYKAVIQSIIGGTMFGFAVSHLSDRQPLQDILRRNQNHASITIAEPDIFDYSDGLPRNPNTLTPLHILDITDEWVKRILINAHNIEKIGLARTRAEAQGMAQSDAGRMYFTADNFRLTKYHDGGWFSTPFNPPGMRDPRRNLFSNGDSSSNIREAEQREQELQNKLGIISRLLGEARTRWQQATQNLQEYKGLGQQVQKLIDTLKRQKHDLELQSHEDAPVEVAALEFQREEHVREKEGVKAQFAQVEARKQQIQEENRPLVERATALRERAHEIEQGKQAARAAIQGLFEQSEAAKKIHLGWKTKLDAANKEAEVIATRVARLEMEYADWHKKASDYCEEVRKPRKTDAVQKEINELEATLKRRERKHGASVEDMEAEFLRATRAVEEAESGLKELKGLIKLLKVALHKRMEKWHTFRRAIALRAKVQFQFHLSRRNYTGKIIFDHGAATLTLRVQTDDQSMTSSTQAVAKDRDPKALSGGEKSYAQICLLLSLWESIGSPIRCLDEFDVFMDNINRRIAMKLMIDTAKTSEAKQYIFISPLDIGNFIEYGPEMKVNRMPDPERGGDNGQTSLQFGGGAT